MGIYLGQLPPAEIARLKAELAETLIANFCYPRFFDHRTESLQMRPVDRAKRQEVWLYLSSVDFTAWSRIDLMTPDIQHQIERLFIQFVQRNRNFFGNQGRRRMADIRLLVNSCSSVVVQSLRNHLTGQKSGNAPFGSPHPVVSWATPSISDRTEPTWEQITASTMLLQQQLQEIRGEAKTAAPVVAQVATPVPAGVGTGMTNGSGRRSSSSATMPPTTRPGAQAGQGDFEPAARNPVAPAASSSRTAQKVAPAAEVKSATATATAARNPQTVDTTPKPPVAAPRKLDSLSQPYDSRSSAPTNRSSRSAETTGGTGSSVAHVIAPSSEPSTAPTPSARTSSGSSTNGTRSSTSSLGGSSPSLVASPPPTAQWPASSLSSTSSLASGTTNEPREMMAVGEDDVAIFEQMRHQLVIWLRIEAVTAGLEITNQGPPQLLELLRQDAHYDETRLQVVSTLLNLANQVIKTGLVSVLDYKQALMFHLMHTRRQ
jgi:hypothetical protein